MTQVVNHKGKRLKVGPRGGVTIHIYTYIDPKPQSLRHAYGKGYLRSVGLSFPVFCVWGIPVGIRNY